MFLGGLWAGGQLCPGGGRVTLNWKTLLEWTAPMLAPGAVVWLRADNAYYKGELVRLCAARGWDYSISVTNRRWRKPVLEQIEGLADAEWTDIGMEEEAIFALHRPTGWDSEQHYVVVRRRTENGQGLLMPRHTVMRERQNRSRSSRSHSTSASQHAPTDAPGATATPSVRSGPPRRPTPALPDPPKTAPPASDPTPRTTPRWNGTTPPADCR